jgi:hypothetical protein
MPESDINGDNAGKVQVYQFQDDTWGQVGDDFLGTSSYDKLGQGLSLNADGSVLAIGAPYNDNFGSNKGLAKVYQRDGNNWVQIGNDISSQFTNEHNHGKSIVLNSSGNRLIVGGTFILDDEQATYIVRIYNLVDDEWIQHGDEIIGESSVHTSCKIKISQDGSTIVISDYSFENLEDHPGSFAVYEITSDSWIQKGESIIGPNNMSILGVSVDINYDGSIVAVSSANNGWYNQVEVYQYSEGNWELLGSQISNGTGGESSFGNSIDLNSEGNIIAIGEPLYNTTGRVTFFNYINDDWIKLGEDIIGEGRSFGERFCLNDDFNKIIVKSRLSTTSEWIVQSFKNELAIVWSPEDQLNVCIEEEIRFEVVAANVSSYQWQISNDGITNWQNVLDNEFYSGSETDELTIQVDASVNNSFYRCWVSDGTEELFSNTAFLQLDSEMPEFVSIPDDQYFEVTESCEINLPDYKLDVIVADNCTGDIELIQEPAPESLIGYGIHQIKLFAIDALDNTNDTSFLVEVVDKISPVIHCAANQEVSADDSRFYKVVAKEFDPVLADDNCGIANITNDFNNSSTLEGAMIPEGVNYIVWSVEDLAGNIMNCSFSIQVEEYNGVLDLAHLVEIYPNPTSKYIILKNLDLSIEKLEIINTLGETTDVIMEPQNHERIDVSELTPGVYFLNLYVEKSILVKKLIIK